MIKTRNEEIELITNKVDEIANGLVHATNAIHRRGFANKNIEMDINGNPIQPRNEKITNINFVA